MDLRHGAARRDHRRAEVHSAASDCGPVLGHGHQLPKCTPRAPLRKTKNLFPWSFRRLSGRVYIRRLSIHSLNSASLRRPIDLRSLTIIPWPWAHEEYSARAAPRRAGGLHIHTLICLSFVFEGHPFCSAHRPLIVADWASSYPEEHRTLALWSSRTQCDRYPLALVRYISHAFCRTHPRSHRDMLRGLPKGSNRYKKFIGTLSGLVDTIWNSL